MSNFETELEILPEITNNPDLSDNNSEITSPIFNHRTHHHVHHH